MKKIFLGSRLRRDELMPRLEIGFHNQVGEV